MGLEYCIAGNNHHLKLCFINWFKFYRWTFHLCWSLHRQGLQWPSPSWQKCNCHITNKLGFTPAIYFCYNFMIIQWEKYRMLSSWKFSSGEILRLICPLLSWVKDLFYKCFYSCTWLHRAYGDLHCMVDISYAGQNFCPVKIFMAVWYYMFY